MAGRRLIQASLVGTALFVVVNVVEVIVLSWTRPVAVIVDLALFGIGCAAFLMAYGIAIGRSRNEEIGVASLYLLTNKVAPNPVRIRLLGAFGVQCVVAVTTASIRPFTTAAFGVLVPMFGLGLSGLWAARHGHFGPRVATTGQRQPAAGSGAAPGAAGGDDAATGADHAATGADHVATATQDVAAATDHVATATQDVAAATDDAATAAHAVTATDDAATAADEAATAPDGAAPAPGDADAPNNSTIEQNARHG